MPVKIFCGKDFSTEHESNQFEEILSLIKDEYENSENQIYILTNFLLSNAQIDVLILATRGPAILELKSYKGKIIGTENGDWKIKTEDGREEKIKNLFNQLKDQRFALLEKLNNIHKVHFPRIEEKKLANIQCWGYFEKGSSYDINQVGSGVRKWFDIITAENLLSKIKFINAGYILNLEDMDAIVKKLSLKEYNTGGIKPKPDLIRMPKLPDTKDKIGDIDKILLIFGYAKLMHEKYAESGYFLLPTAKENILLNLERFKIPIASEQLKEFLDAHKNEIRIQENNLKYWTGSHAYYHPYTKSGCEDPEKTEKSIHLTDILTQKAEDAYRSYNPDVNQIYRCLIEKIKNVEDLFFLLLLKEIAGKNCQGNPADIAIGPNATLDMGELLKDLGADEKAINCLNSKLRRDLSFFEKYLPSDKYSFLRLTAHRFNSSSCSLIDNLFLQHELAEFLYEKLDKLPIENFIADAYKLKISDFEMKYGKLYSKVKIKLKLFDESYNKKIYVFNVQEYENELSECCQKGLLIVEDDEIKIKDRDKFWAYFRSLEEKEENLINVFLEQWLSVKIRIEDGKIFFGEKNIAESTELREEKRPVREVQGKVATSGVSMAQIEPPSSKPEEIIIGSKDYPKQYGVIGLSEDGRKILLDLNAPHIIFVSGMMGAGKGYTIGVISEMLIGKGIPNISNVSKPVTVIVLYKPKDDVPSEFWSIRQPNDVGKEIDSLNLYNAEPMNPITEDQFRVFLDPGVYGKYRDKFISEYKTQNIYPLYIDPSTLSGEDWANALATGGSSDALYVKKIFKILRNLPADFDMEDIANGVNASDLTEAQKGLAKARLEILDEYLKKDDIINNLVIGGVNILDFRKAMYQPDDIFTIMTLIMSKLQNKKEFENEPFAFIMNEAHLYFKKGISKEFLDTIENLIRRKRHGANWLLIDTHLPVDVDSKVIELSDIKVLHFTDKTVDSPVLKRILEGRDDRLYKLQTGEAIICANQSSLGLSVPILVQIRPRVSKHGGATKTAI